MREKGRRGRTTEIERRGKAQQKNKKRESTRETENDYVMLCLVGVP
jgi:hypothetical protein